MSEEKYFVGWVSETGLHGHFATGHRDHASALSSVKSMERADRSRAWGVVGPDEIDDWHVAERQEKAAMEAEPKLRNARGQLVPERLIPSRTLLEHQTVTLLVQHASEMQTLMRAFKDGAFSDLREFRDTIAGSYGAQRQGTRGGVTLSSYDGLMRVEVSVADTLALGPEIEAAKALIDQCIEAWSEGGNENLRAVTFDAFRVGAGGKLQVDRVLGLRRLDIDDDRWRQAMLAINDAIRQQSSRTYVRFYTRPDVDADWTQIGLDMSRL